MPAAAPSAEQPQPEAAFSGPPTGWQPAPGLRIGGYGTVQLLVPHGSTLRSTPPNTPTADDGGNKADAEPHDEYHDGPQASNRTRLNLSHLSAFAWWDPHPDLQLFGEIDAEDVLQLPGHADEHDGHDSASYLSLERLYLDWRASDSLTLRLGKFLTPIGRWNQEHSDPLTWSTLRPLISRSAFPTHATGVQATGGNALAGTWLDYQLWASSGGEWRAAPGETPFGHALGLRLAGRLAEVLQWGVSLSRFSQSRQDAGTQRYALAAADLTWRQDGLELSAEAIERRSLQADARGERGGFVQGVLPLTGPWFVVGRIEVYRRAGESGSTHSQLIGVVMRSGRHGVLKVEWVQRDAQAEGLPRGLLASATWLF